MLEVSHINRGAAHDAFLRAHGLARLDWNTAPWDKGPNGRVNVQFHGEHCTECAAPDCHATCDLYVRGRHGFCARFVGGIVACRAEASPTGWSFEILARPWSMFMCVGHTLLMSRRGARRLTSLMLWAGVLARMALWPLRCLPPTSRWRIVDRARGLWNRIPRALNRYAVRRGMPADALLLVAGNPAETAVEADLVLSGFGDSQGGRSFRRKLRLRKGWTRVEIPVREIAAAIDLTGLFRIALLPQIDAPTFLQIGYLGFIAAAGKADGRAAASAAAPTARGKPGVRIKLVVTDLDDTLWDGILVEEPERLPVLRKGVRESMDRLDRRGILMSIASKNNAADALAALEKLGVRTYFLYPRIDWEPKSANIRRIARDLNIGTDSVAFVDDSPFERAEVAAALPEVAVFDAGAWQRLPDMPRFDAPATAEAGRRRELYRREADRREEHERSGLDYDAFLASCGMCLELLPLSDDRRERVAELVQRTNQLNFSGRHYTRDELARILDEPGILPVVMECRDRFGDYGIVGFAILRRAEGVVELRDLMLSCRIQGKKVEHALLVAIAEAAAGGMDCCRFRYRPTVRNAPAGRVFKDLKLARAGTEEDGAVEVFEAAPGVVFPDSPVSLMDRIGLREAMA